MPVALADTEFKVTSVDTVLYPQCISSKPDIFATFVLTYHTSQKLVGIYRITVAPKCSQHFSHSNSVDVEIHT